MVGSGKLAKINYRLQDLAIGKEKKLFFGGKSSITTGDWFQLPPVKDKYVFQNTPLDDRPRIAPSHWDENYTICFLKEKMRSKDDLPFGELCDRIARNVITDDDETFLQSLVRDSPNENNNEMYQKGTIGILVTTNEKRKKINREKLDSLLPYEESVTNMCEDKCTNIINAPIPPSEMSYTQAKGLPSILQLKIGAPILITVNDSKYKQDGICNGVKGYIDSFQYSEDNPENLRAIWVVFRNENIGRRLKMDKYELRALHSPNNSSAVPIELTKTRFEINQGNHKYVRKQFPMVLGYATTCHKSQGDSMTEVIIDFECIEGKKRPFIIPGLFYVAITRASKGENVYLKSWKRSFIKVDRTMAKKLDDMCITRPYQFLKMHNDDEVFEVEGKELKVGYLNVNGILHSCEYLNNDRNMNNLDLLIVAETKLTNRTSNELLSAKLEAFRILHRFDAQDGQEHMGFLILSPKENIRASFDPSITRQYSDQSCQIIIHDFGEPINVSFAFIYLRPNKGTNDQIKMILEKYECDNCHIIMGDLNLNPRDASEKARLNQLCANKKDIALKEVTTRQKNQLDHILVDKCMKNNVYVTSFVNFTSDHKCIVLRYGIEDNKVKENIVNIDKKSFSRSCKKPVEREEDIQRKKIGLKCEDSSVKHCEENKLMFECSDNSQLVVIEDDSPGRDSDINKPTFDSLQDGELVNDEVINMYSTLIQKHCTNVFIFSTFFYGVLQTSPERAKRHAKGRNIFESRFILFPIHEVNHWYLILVDNENGIIESLDPFVYQSRKATQTVRSQQRKKKESIKLYLMSLKHYPHTLTYRMRARTDIPKQRNVIDCGVFLLMFMKYTVSGKSFDFDEQDMPNFRKSIREELTKGVLDVEIMNSEQEEESNDSISIDQGELPKRPPRFENPSATICWLNSILQLIIPTMTDPHPNTQLRNLLAYYSDSENINNAQQMRDVLSDKYPMLRDGHQDPFDFFTAMTLFDEIESLSITTPLLLQMTQNIICMHNALHISDNTYSQEFYLEVNMPQSINGLKKEIEDCLTSTELIHDWRCDECQLYGGKKIKCLMNSPLPNYVLIKLRRGILNNDGTLRKNNKMMNPPLSINVTAHDQTQSQYNLCGIVTHIGGIMEKGHYISEVKYGNTWFKCNDSTITETSYHNLSKCGYGFMFEKD